MGGRWSRAARSVPLGLAGVLGLVVTGTLLVNGFGLAEGLAAPAPGASTSDPSSSVHGPGSSVPPPASPVPPPAPGRVRGHGEESRLAEFAWLTGTWRGRGPGGTVAEIHYMTPEANVLPSIFRLLEEDRVVVLEALTLVVEEGGTFMYVRHFDTALVPLEKEHAIKLELVGRDGDNFLFENVHEEQNPRRSVMTRTEHGFISRSELARDDGSTDEIRVEYRRVEPDDLQH